MYTTFVFTLVHYFSFSPFRFCGEYRIYVDPEGGLLLLLSLLVIVYQCVHVFRVCTGYSVFFFPIPPLLFFSSSLLFHFSLHYTRTLCIWVYQRKVDRLRARIRGKERQRGRHLYDIFDYVKHTAPALLSTPRESRIELADAEFHTFYTHSCQSWSSLLSLYIFHAASRRAKYVACWSNNAHTNRVISDIESTKIIRETCSRCHLVCTLTHSSPRLDVGLRIAHRYTDNDQINHADDQINHLNAFKYCHRFRLAPRCMPAVTLCLHISIRTYYIAELIQNEILIQLSSPLRRSPYSFAAAL